MRESIGERLLTTPLLEPCGSVILPWQNGGWMCSSERLCTAVKN
jgi:hypothetical protein